MQDEYDFLFIKISLLLFLIILTRDAHMCIDLTVDKYIQGQGHSCHFIDTENED